MKRSVNIQIDKHPRERDLAGQIILAYGDLEHTLLDLVSAALNGDTKTALRSLFRLRSESNRIAVADAIARPWFRQHRIEKEFERAYQAIRHCMKIRNQYAHCSWISSDGILRFGSMDQAAKGNDEEAKIHFHPISHQLLKAQLDYFSYASQCMLRASDQYRLKTKQERLVDWEVPPPPKTAKPNLDSHGETRFRLQIGPTKKPHE